MECEIDTSPVVERVEYSVCVERCDTMLDTDSSLETLEVWGKDRIGHSWFPTDPPHYFCLVCHLTFRRKKTETG